MGGSSGEGHATADLKACNRLLGLVSFFAAVGGFLFGYDLALIGGALLYIEKDFGIDEEEIEIVVAGTKIGAVFGTFIGGWLMQQFGRRMALTVITIFFIAGPVTMAVSETVPVLAFGRVLAGLGVGASAVVCPAYTAEMAPPSLRGSMVSMYEIMLCFGMLVAVIVDYCLAPLPLGVNWRWMVGLPAIFACVQLMVPCMLPESPYWLVSQDKSEEGLKVLRAIYDTKENRDNKMVAKQAEEELEAVRKSYAKSRKDNAQMFFEQSSRCCNGCACLRGCECVRNLMRRLAAVSVELWNGAERRATRLVMIMALINQLCASTAIINYAPTVIISLQPTSEYNGTNITTSMCTPCGGERNAPTGACGQWGYGEDPWNDVFYQAVSPTGSVNGAADVSGFGLDVASGVSLFTDTATLYDGPYNAYGRAIVVHDETGVRVGCGCCAGAGDEVTGLSEITIRPYPDYTGDVTISGSVEVTSASSPATTLQLAYNLEGLRPAEIGGLHIHTGTSCSVANAVGGHLFAASAADDPLGVLQVCNVAQAMCVPADDTGCVCQSTMAEELCNETDATQDPWSRCHYCDNTTAVLENEAEAVGQSAAIAGAKLVGMVTAILLIDSKYGGRRPLLIYGSYAMGIAMACLTAAVWIESLVFALISMATFILAFSTSWAGGFWVVVSEVFTMRMKAVAAPIATAVLFAAGALANVTFLTAYNAMGPGAFLMYGTVSLAGGMYLQVYLPETKGQSLAEVQALLQDPENNTHGHFGYVCGCWPCCPEFVHKGKAVDTRRRTYITSEAVGDDADSNDIEMADVQIAMPTKVESDDEQDKQAEGENSAAEEETDDVENQEPSAFSDDDDSARLGSSDSD